MRYISKHEADVYLDKEEEEEKKNTERTEDRENGLDSSSFFKRQLWTALQWSQFPFLHNTVGWSYICLTFLYSSSKIQRQRPLTTNGAEIRKLTVMQNSLHVKTSKRGTRFRAKCEKQNNMHHLRRYMHVK